MSQTNKVENARAVIESEGARKSVETMLRSEGNPVDMADLQLLTLSPKANKPRSLPNTPSQRPQSPPARKASPSTSQNTRECSPHIMRSGLSRTPPVHKRGMICKYETGMRQARRRVPYTLGPEMLEADTAAMAQKLNEKEQVRLTEEMNLLYENLVPTEESEDRRRRLVEKLERLLRDRWPGQLVTVSVFGSTGNKLGTKDSDVDICISTDCKDVEHVCSIADLLARNGMERVVCVSSARVPIVKVWDPDLQVSCDMNVNNPIALVNTELIKSYVAIDDRFRPLAMIVKYWAKRRILNDAALGGTLSSYTWICLVLNFLQTRNPPILPSLQSSPDLQPHLLNGVNVAFDRDLAKYKGFGKANTSDLGDLLFQFFRYFGHELDFERNVLSVRRGALIPKTEKNWHLLQDNRLCVEEPFNIGRNLANTADDTSMRGIHLELRRAFNLVTFGRLSECCEQYIPPAPDPAPKRLDAFIAPTTKAIIPQPPPQVQPIPLRSARNDHKNARRGGKHNTGSRRASNPAARPATHLHDLPFQMTPQELQLQQQHQQHLLHDQLFQQYQYLQLQEQELRLQLYRHRGLVAAGAFSSTESTDDGQDQATSSRTSVTSRLPMTAPLHQSRFAHNALQMNHTVSSQGIVTNPASPLLPNTVLDNRRYARRASINSAAANTLRAHSQPARVVSALNGIPYMTQRIDVPVRQADPLASRRSSAAQVMNDPLNAYMQARLQQSRYDAGRRPVEYVGYYVGQSPTLSAYQGSTTISPVPSSAGLAIHNGGLSPRMSTRSSRLPSVSTSPTSHYTAVVNGPSVMTPVSENVNEVVESAPISAPSPNTRPLIVDGSINSPPRRQQHTRLVRSSSEEFDISVTTSEDVPLDTPSSSDEMSNNGNLHAGVLNGLSIKQMNGDIVQERDYLSLNGTSTGYGEAMPYEDADSSALLRKMEKERNLQNLTNALAAATISNGYVDAVESRRQYSATSSGASGPPLLPLVNGAHLPATSNVSATQEWQVQSKKKKNKKKGVKADAQDKPIHGVGETLPQDESLRKGG